MYICICNNINEEKLKDILNNNHSIGNHKKLAKTCDIQFKCGKCIPYINKFILTNTINNLRIIPIITSEKYNKL